MISKFEFFHDFKSTIDCKMLMHVRRLHKAYAALYRGTNELMSGEAKHLGTVKFQCMG